MQRIYSAALLAVLAIAYTACGCVQIIRRFDSRRLHLLNQEPSNDLEKSEKSLGVIWECSTDGDCRSAAVAVSVFEPTMAHIAERWPHLQPHIREAIITLIDCSGRDAFAAGGQS
jgi:hypothetical protein